jgi:hypothetical protein
LAFAVEMGVAAALKGLDFSRADCGFEELFGFSPGGNAFRATCLSAAAKTGVFFGILVARLKPCPFNAGLFESFDRSINPCGSFNFARKRRSRRAISPSSTS